MSERNPASDLARASEQYLWSAIVMKVMPTADPAKGEGKARLSHLKRELDVECKQFVALELGTALKQPTSHIYSGTAQQLLDEIVARARRIDDEFHARSSGEEATGRAEESAKPKAGCFIASAVYQSPYHPDVQALRSFRDRVLTRSVAGRAFIWVYNHSAPFAAKRIGQRPWLRAAIRMVLLAPFAGYLRHHSNRLR